MQLIEILKEAIKKVPFVKYALGVAGVAAAIAIIKSFGIDNYQIPVISVLILFGLMALLFVFSSFAKSKDVNLKRGAYFLIYTTIIITCLSAFLLFTAVFFKFPSSIDNIVGPTNTENYDTAEVKKWMGSLRIKYLTYDRMENPTNLNIEYYAIYDKNAKLFINSSSVDFNESHSSDFLALVEGNTNRPMKVKIISDSFQITYNDWKTMFKSDSIRYKNKNASSIVLHVRDFLN